MVFSKPEPGKRDSLRCTMPATQVRMGEEWDLSFGFARNISRSGIFIQTVSPKDVGEEFEMEFTVPDTPIEVKCKARVVWRNGQTVHGAGIRMGLQFSLIDPSTAEMIDNWVTSRLRTPQ